MVLFVSCSSSSSCYDNQLPQHGRPTSQPTPIRSNRTYDDCTSTSPLSRSSPLSTSAESVSSIKSSSSTRTWAEREMERAQRRQLLDTSLAKMRSSSNMPLRKHLLVYNTVRALQHELDILDDEDLYCELIGDGAAPMDVDEWRWVRACQPATPSPVSAVTNSNIEKATVELDEDIDQEMATAVPPKSEENVVVAGDRRDLAVLRDETFEMEDVKETSATKRDSTWSWEANDSFYAAFDNSASTWGSDNSIWGCSSTLYAGSNNFGGNGSTMFNQVDLWGSSDLLGGPVRFDLEHLFPSQVLMQA